MPLNHSSQVEFEKRTRPQSERALGGKAAHAERAGGRGNVRLEQTAEGGSNAKLSDWKGPMEEVYYPGKPWIKTKYPMVDSSLPVSLSDLAPLFVQVSASISL
jgi:hypothetical protein